MRTLPALLAALLVAVPVHAEDGALDRAATLLEQGHLQDAETLARESLKRAPDDPEMRFLLGKIKLDEQAGNAAERELRTARRAGMPDDLVLPLLGRALLLQGKFQPLLNELDTGLDMSEPLRSRILTARALAHASLGDREEARRDLDGALVLDPRNREARLVQARLALVNAQPKLAADSLQPLLTSDSDCAECWELAGEIAQREGQDQRAAQAFAQALQLDPERFLALLGRAATALDANDTDSADLVIDSARKLRPADPMLAYLGAVLAFRRNDLSTARRQLDTAIEVRPDYVPALLLDGLIAAAEGNTANARTRLRRVLSSLPGNVTARTALAKLDLEDGTFSDVVTLLQPIIEQGQAGLPVKTMLASALFKTGRADEAERMLGEVIAASPPLRLEMALGKLASGEYEAGITALDALAKDDSERAAYYLVIALLKGHRIDDAASLAARLAERHPENAALRNLVGAVALAQGREQDALGAFRKAVELQASFPAAQLNLSRAALLSGDTAAAQAQLRKLLDAHPDHTEARLQLARIAAVQGNDVEVTAQLEAIQKTHPGELRSGELLVENLLRGGQLDSAQAIAFQLVDRQPESTLATQLLARARIAAGYYPEAIALLAKRVHTPGADFADWYYYAEALLGAHRVGDAIDAYQQAAILAPRSDLRAAMRMTRLQAGSARESDAKRELRRLILLHPHDASPNEMLGDILAKEGDREAAHASYAKAMNLAPSANLLVKLYRSAAGTDAKADAERLATLRDWRDQHPQDLPVRLLLAGELIRHGGTDDVAEGIDEYQAVLKMAPDNLIALNNLAMQRLQDAPEQALELATRAHDAAPDDPIVTDTYAQALVAMQRAGEAIPLLNRAINALRTEPALRYHLALAYEQDGQRKEAGAQLRRLLITYADFPDKAAATAMLDRLRTY